MTFSTSAVEAASSPDHVPNSTPDPAWSLGRRFMMRISGLPMESIRELRTPRTAEWADSVAEHQARLSERAAHLSDLLHEIVGTLVDDRLRRNLVNIRRQLFNNRLPRDMPDALVTAAAIGGEAGELLADWLRDRQSLEADRTTGDTLLSEELASARAALRSLADEPRLRQGLVLASPALDRFLDTYAHSTVGKLTKQQRKLERSLLEYVYRTACKTSPFSTLTGVALGEFGSAGDPGSAVASDAGLFVGRVEDEWSDHVQLNVAVLGRLAELITANPALRADLPVTLVSGWQREMDRIRYVRRTVTAGDDDATVSFDAVKESLFFLRQGSNIDLIFAAFDRKPCIRYQDLVNALSEASEATVEDYDRFLSILLGLGLLQVPTLSVDIHSLDPLRSFRESVRGLETKWASEMAELLDAPIRLMESYPMADLPRRRELLEELRAQFSVIQQSLGSSSAALPQTLVYEDSRAAAAVQLSDGDEFTDSVGTALQQLSRLAPAFDITLPNRLTLKGFFLARYGRGGTCEDVLKLVHDFQEDIYEQYLRVSGARQPFRADGSYVPIDNWLFLPEIFAVDRAREEFTRQVRERYGAMPAGEDELLLDDDFIEAVAGEVDQAVSGYRPEAHFVQLARRADGVLAVLNRSWGGVSFPFSRFTHCFEDLELADRLRHDLRDRQPKGAVFAEVTGGFATTNLNLHGRLTDYEIVCPGETSSVPAEAQIPLDDLQVEHDPAADRLVLRSRRLRREVIPVYLGYLLPMALPEVPRVLLLFSPATMATLDVWSGVPKGEASAGVTVRPRVRYGNVVMSRRSWTADATHLPVRGSQDSDAEWFLGWRTWRQRFGIPAQVYATAGQTARTEDGEEQAEWHGKEKPHYVDFDSYLSLMVFERLLGGKDEVVLREALPAESELYATSDRGHHMTELVLETTSAASHRPESI